MERSGVDGQMSCRVTSVVGGNELSGAPGGNIQSVNPASTSEVVAEVRLRDASTFAVAAQAARAAERF
jgi:alpha-ketoglutaric semialdehyde dehydrogenase